MAPNVLRNCLGGGLLASGTSRPQAAAKVRQLMKPLIIVDKRSTDNKSSTHCSIGNRNNTDTAQAHQAGNLLKFKGALPHPNNWDTAPPNTIEDDKQHHIATTNKWACSGSAITCLWAVLKPLALALWGDQ